MTTATKKKVRRYRIDATDDHDRKLLALVDECVEDVFAKVIARGDLFDDDRDRELFFRHMASKFTTTSCDHD